VTGAIASHTIRVLGKDIPVRTVLNEEHVRRVEAFVNARVEKVSGNAAVVDSMAVAVLAMMNLAEECIALSGELDACREGRDRLSLILERLDSVR
jgi:cell division protein ZapA